MIRRLVQGVAVVGIAFTGWLFQSPPEQADLGLAPEPAPPLFAGCLAEAGRGLDGSVSIGSIVRGSVSASLSAQPDMVTSEIDPAGGASIPLAELGAAGPVGILVEMPSADASAAVVETGETGTFLARCTPPSSDVVIAAGGSTLAGEELFLVITNPYAVDAVVSVTSSSEVGEDSTRELSSILVPASSTIVEELAPILSLRQSLSMKLVVERGAVHAGMLQLSGSDAAFVEAVEPSGDWWLAVSPVEGRTQRLVVSTDSLLPVDIRVDTYADGLLTEAVVEAEIPARGQMDIPVETLLQVAGGVRVSADGPVVVNVIDSGEAVRAISPAAATLSTEWLIHTGGLAPAEAWIFNPGEVDAEVVLQPLVPDTPARAVIVPARAGSIVPLGVAGPGYLVRSTSELAVFSAGAGGAGIGLATGFPVAVLTE